jgi:hypothetical protein
LQASAKTAGPRATGRRDLPDFRGRDRGTTLAIGADQQEVIMDKKKVGWFGVAVTAFSFAGAGIAVAQPQPAPQNGAETYQSRRAELLTKYDANKNGKLDPDEREAMRSDWRAKFEARRAEVLKKYDLNHDGKLDQGERTAMRQDRVKERFAQLDANHDGAVSLDEFQAGIAQHRQGRFGARFHLRGFGHHRFNQDKGNQ